MAKQTPIEIAGYLKEVDENYEYPKEVTLSVEDYEGYIFLINYRFQEEELGERLYDTLESELKKSRQLEVKVKVEEMEDNPSLPETTGKTYKGVGLVRIVRKKN